VFSKTTKTIEEIHELCKAAGINSVVYHSKLKKKEKQAALEAASTPECRVILSAQALTTGYNLPEIDAGICISGDSSSIVNTQSLGRCLRFVPGKQAKFFNLYVGDTQEEVWIRKKTSSLSNVTWVKNTEL